ncbi:GNAT family N-acetyltransferase [Azospirillum sp.]|uniref:GNAT family N-acetyltransferase n=1 Tax=Azospirillum sp. TaxID=34012 RepID=UPI002D66E127|nr:GNAT family N-acetyltransferase [Azospirillum sp.]HYD71288.1 GNAT family N-acetyltransferase [Azospirillum sp.]
MDAERFVVRPMSRAELDLAVEWAAREGWNPGLHDTTAFHAVDPAGFLAGVLDGRPVTSISAVRYPGGFGFIGLYIALPEVRGKGYGLRTWQAALDHLAGHVTGLDGVVAQQENYRRSGFTLAYRNIRYAGTPPAGPVPQGLADARTVPMGALLDLDAALFLAPRPGFLAAWIALPGGAALAAVDDGRVTGFGVARPCREGFKIGPLYADDPATAERLFLGLGAAAGGGLLFLDVPEVNPQAVQLAERHGFTPMFETARMYNGPAPEPPLDRLYGVTTFELG